MRIECPSCTTSYEIAESAVGPKGRKMKCGKCAITWQVEPLAPRPAKPPAEMAKPTPPAAAPAIKTPVEDTEPADDWGIDPSDSYDADPVAETEDDAAAAFAALSQGEPLEPEPAKTPPKTPSVNLLEGLDAKSLASDGISNVADGDGEPLVFESPRITVKESLASIEANVASALAEANDTERFNGGAHRRGGRREMIRRSFEKDGKARNAIGYLSIAASIALIATVVILRHPIVRAAPDLAGLYESIGLDVNLRGLAFRDIRMLRDQGAGGPVFVVEGLIENVSSRTVRLPEVLFSLRDDTASELFSWTTRLSLTALPPGEMTRFKTELASAPAIATDVMVRFNDRPMRRAGL